MIRERFQGAKFSVSVLFSLALVIPSGLTSSIGAINVVGAGCSTTGCTAAEQIDKLRNESNENVSPCDNLYQQVCGNHNESTPDEKWKYYMDEAEKRVGNLIEDIAARDNDFRPFELIEQVYNTCMDETTGLEDLIFMHQTLEKMRAAEFDWVDAMIKAQDIGMPVKFLNIEPEPTLDGHSISMSYILNIAPDEFKRNISDPSDPLKVSYTSYVKHAFTNLGYIINHEEIEELVEFERNISEIHQRSYDKPYESKVTVEILTKEYPSVNWDRLITNILLRNIKPASKIQDLVLLVRPPFSDFLDLLVKTPKRVQSNYAAWKMLQTAVPFLGLSFLQAESEYCLVKNCKSRTHKNACINLVKEYLKPALTLAYAKAHFTSDVESLVVDVVARVKEQYTHVIKQSTWWDEEDKNRGVGIIKDTPIIFGYDQRKRSDEDFIKFYEDLEIDTSNFLQTMANLEKFDVKHRFNNATGLGPRELVNPLKNFSIRNVAGSIYIPLASLGEPIFKVLDPMYKIIGSLGGAFAFMLTKNIVHPDRNLDGDKEIDNEVISCLRRQLTPLQNPKANQLLNSLDLEIQTQIAVQISYLAYRQWATEHENEAADNKLFWMDLIRMYCVNPSVTKVIDHKYGDLEYHILRAVSNVPQFWEDLNCAKDESVFAKDFGESCSYF